MTLRSRTCERLALTDEGYDNYVRSTAGRVAFNCTLIIPVMAAFLLICDVMGDNSYDFDISVWVYAAILCVSAALSYAAVAWTLGSFQRWMGLLYLAVFVVYMVVSTMQMKKHPELAEEGAEEESDGKERSFAIELLLLVVGAAAIAIGARLLVDNGTLIAAALGVPDSVIGLTMIALGTSLPELITAITSLVKGHGSLSLGNIIGANLFNIVLVSGMAISLSPFAIPAEKTVMGGINSSLVIDLPIMLAVMAIMCLPALFKGKLSRWQGIVLLCIYAGFTVYQFVV